MGFRFQDDPICLTSRRGGRFRDRPFPFHYLTAYYSISGPSCQERARTAGAGGRTKIRSGFQPNPVITDKSRKVGFIFPRRSCNFGKPCYNILIEICGSGSDSGSRPNAAERARVSEGTEEEKAGHGLRTGCRPGSAFHFSCGPVFPGCGRTGGNGSYRAAVVPYAGARYAHIRRRRD